MCKLGACGLAKGVAVYTFVSMAAGSMSSSKHVCWCMFACSEGGVFKGKDKKVRTLSATAHCSLLSQLVCP